MVTMGSRAPTKRTAVATRSHERDQDPSQRSILMVAPAWPYPPTWGFATRVYHLAKELAKRHRVSLLTYGRVGAALGEAAAMFESVDVVASPVAETSKRRRQARSVFSARSAHLGGLRSDQMIAAVANLLAQRRFDLVQLESTQMAFCGAVTDAPVALDEHNVEYLLLKRLASAESVPARKAFGYLEAAKARREEARAWRRADGVIFTSSADLEVMRVSLPYKSGCVVPNGVDVERFKPSDMVPEPNTVVFTGAINYRPNTDAVAFFVRDVLPRLRRLQRSTRFVVVGRGAPDWLVRMAGPEVEFTGEVPDVRPYLARAHVVVAPLRAGSGTRLKILEAMAMGKPVVSTAIGCEGLRVVDGEDISIADDPQALAESTAHLMSHPARAIELGRNARLLAERDYSWPVVAQRLDNFHSQLLSKETRVG